MNHKPIIICAVFLLMLTVGFYVFSTGKPVESKDDAIAIAQKHVSQKYSDDFSNCNISATLQEQIWIVSYSRPTDDGKYLLGGGCPEVRINQTNGNIISCLLQK